MPSCSESVAESRDPIIGWLGGSSRTCVRCLHALRVDAYISDEGDGEAWCAASGALERRHGGLCGTQSMSVVCRLTSEEENLDAVAKRSDDITAI